MTDTAAGYAHPGYAASFSAFGVARELPLCGGWILERQIPGSDRHDAMGCYPLFTCLDWSRLPEDLEALAKGMVSLSLVADPFGAYEPDHLRGCFDVARPFKDHFVFDCSQSVEDVAPKYHRKNARRALRRLRVETAEDPQGFVDEWASLYGGLVERHGITGMRAFSREAFAEQLVVPGIVMFRALDDGECVGAHLWYVQGEVAYSHLSAYSPRGYELDASYALNWQAAEHFGGRLRWLDLGAGAGIDGRDNDGLTQFKRGWATGTRPAWFCGRVFDPAGYTEIARARGVGTTDYFPAYRQGEFG